MRSARFAGLVFLVLCALAASVLARPRRRHRRASRTPPTVIAPVSLQRTLTQRTPECVDTEPSVSRSRIHVVGYNGLPGIRYGFSFAETAESLFEAEASTCFELSFAWEGHAIFFVRATVPRFLGIVSYAPSNEPTALAASNIRGVMVGDAMRAAAEVECRIIDYGERPVRMCVYGLNGPASDAGVSDAATDTPTPNASVITDASVATD